MERSYAEHYAETSVATVSQERLIVLLYEGAIRFIDGAIRAVERGEIAERGRQIDRAVQIVHELRTALDLEVGGEVAQRLAALYDFTAERLVSANAQGDGAALRAVARILQTLLESWRKVLQTQPVVASAPASPPLVMAQAPVTAAGAGLSLVA